MMSKGHLAELIIISITISERVFCTEKISGAHLCIIQASLVVQMVKNGFICNAGARSFSPWVGNSPGEGHGNPLQFSYVENSMDRGAWQATVHGVPKTQD